MQVQCPKCSLILSGDDMNVVTDIARCPDCGEVFKLSTLVQVSASGPADVNDPPKGAWYREDFNGFEVGSTTRHPAAFFLVPFMCVWSGGSLGGIYGMQIAKGKFDLFTSLFGIPFFLGTLVLGAVVLMTVCGKVVVRIFDGEGEIFTGVGSLGWRRRFDWKQVTGVSVEASMVNSRNGQPAVSIVLEGPQKVKFGSGLLEPRRDFIANVLRLRLLNKAGY